MSKVKIPEPTSREFQDRDGKWCGFIDQRHYENTLADGSWPIRDLFAAEQMEAYAAARVKEALEWVSAHDQMPSDDKTPILAVHSSGEIEIVWGRLVHERYPDAIYLYWMPLPAPPQQ